jgi:TonB family protein
MKSFSRLLKSTSVSLFCLFGIVLFSHTSSMGQTDDYSESNILAKIDELKQKIALNANDALLHYQLGELNLRLPRYPEAIDALTQAVQIKPDFAVAYYRLGWAYAEQRKYDEALKAHEQAVTSVDVTSFKLKLDKSPALHAIGWDYYCLGNYDKAIAAYQQSLEYHPRFEDSLYEIGRVRIAQGNRDEVMQIAAKLSSPLNEWLLKELSLSTPRARPEINKQSSPTPPAQSDQTQPEPMKTSLKPTILYKEKAKYTEVAQQQRIRGTVVLNVTFFSDGQIGSVRVLRALPYGLTGQALTAAERIRFNPALKDGQPVSVRGNLEFNFNLY